MDSPVESIDQFALEGHFFKRPSFAAAANGSYRTRPSKDRHVFPTAAMCSLAPLAGMMGGRTILNNP
jgi:hypothetical protein